MSPLGSKIPEAKPKLFAKTRNYRKQPHGHRANPGFRGRADQLSLILCHDGRNLAAQIPPAVVVQGQDLEVPVS